MRQVAGYDQARWALSAHQLSKDPARAWEALGYPAPAAGGGGWIRNLTNIDPPDHTRLRRLLAGALTPGRMAAMAPRIAAVAGGLASCLAGADVVDLIASYLVPLQTSVTADLLGIPPACRDKFGILATGLLGGPGLPGARDEAYRRLGLLIGELLELRAVAIGPDDSPGAQPDLLGALLAVHDGSDRLSPAEARSMAMLMITAGQEPTIDLIANGMLALLTHPDQLALFARNPGLRARALEELLRLEAPVCRAVRIAAEDLPIDGTVVAAGSVVEVCLDRAHQDPAHFARPDSLDITRKHAANLTFGHGIHYCAGAPLARVHARIALATLVDRYPAIGLAASPGELRWQGSPDRHSLLCLPVRLGPPACRGAALV